MALQNQALSGADRRTHNHVLLVGDMRSSVSCCDHDCQPAETGGRYHRILWVALGLNAAMFLVEIVASVIAGSVSLRADALDFLGDAANYAIALAVVGLALNWRARAALLKGSVMGMFGLWVAGSTIYSAVTATVPKAEVMGVIGLLALGVNLGVAGLLYRYRDADSQALSVWLCTRNDCIQHRGDPGRCRRVGVHDRMAGYRRGRHHRLSRPVIGGAHHTPGPA